MVIQAGNPGFAWGTDNSLIGVLQQRMDRRGLQGIHRVLLWDKSQQSQSRT